MVMHARKLPRIDDGYPDKREAQSYQSSQYPSKTGYSNHSDRYERRRSPVRDSPASRGSPRYHNKASYIERNKEKYERGNENSPGKKINHNFAGGSSNANGGNHDKTRNASNPKDKTEVQKSAIRICGDWSEHLSSTGKKYYYNLKTELSQWERPKEWNEASAVRPERPERHSTDSRTSNDKHSSKDTKNRHSSGGIEKREKHLRELRHMVADSNPKPDKMYLFEKLQQGQSQLQDELRANKHIISSDSRDSLRPNDDSSTNDYPNSSHTSRTRRDSEGTRTLGRQTSRNDQDELESPGSTPTSHRSGSTPLRCHNPVSNISSISSIPSLISQLNGGQNNQELTNQALQTLQKLQQALSKQIAAHQTSVSTQSSQPSLIQASPRHHLQDETLNLSYQQQLLHHQLQQQQQQQQQQLLQQSFHGTVQTSSTASHSLHRSPYMNSQNNIQVLDTSPQPIVTMAAVSPVAMTTGSTSIPITHSLNQVHRGNTVYGKFLGSQNQNLTSSYQQPMDDMLNDSLKGTDRGGGTDDRNCCSPTPSDTSSQGAPVDPDMFTNSMPQKDTNLMTSLGQYYNEKLVSHVTGWQGELFEKQAKLYRDEALKIGNLISSQVSVELKRARSLVRVEEIQATLHEQRNLFLAQQIAELENMKPVSSVSSFLPTSTASSTS